MTLKTMGRRMANASAATILSAAMGLGLTACSSNHTVAFLYATAAQNNPGVISGYKIDFQAGRLSQLADSPVPSGGRNPVALVPSPDHRFIYVVHRDDSTVVYFAIGTDGKLYAQHTYNVTGSFPLAASIDASGKFLYVPFTYQKDANGNQLYTPANPGPGGVTVFPINTTDGSLGTPSTTNLGRAPVGVIATSQNHFVYFISQDSATGNNLYGFSADPNTGALTPLPGITINPGNVASVGFPSGVTPSAIIEDPSSTHLYITDRASNQLLSYSIASNGVPSLLPNGTVATDAAPAGLTIDITGKFLFVVNYTGGTIGGYTFGSSGQAVPSTTAASTQAGTGPTCVTTVGSPTNASPTQGIYLYTSNSLSNSITGQQIIPADGSMRQIFESPFGSATLPTCVIAVPTIQ